MNIKQSLIRLFHIILINVSLLACTSEPPPLLRLGTVVWPGYEPLYLARHKGLLNSDEIRLVEYSSASQVLQAYRNNLIDAAALTLDESLRLLQSSEDVRLVLVLDISNGADAIIAQHSIKGIKDLKGKKIGVEHGALGAYFISRALEIAGLDRESIQIIPLTIDEQEAAFKQGEIDAVVTFEPVRSKLLAYGGHSIIDSRQLPGEIIDVLVVRNTYLHKHMDKIKQLRKIWYQTLNLINTEPLKSAVILGQRMKLSAQQTQQTYEGLILANQNENEKLLGGKASKLQRTSQHLMKVLVDNHLLISKVNTEILFEYIHSIHTELK
ncbi:MAG: ABC transporter substrate-binding protein [Bermanella sp.]